MLLLNLVVFLTTQKYLLNCIYTILNFNHFTMEAKEQELITMLTKQHFDDTEWREDVLDKAKRLADAYTQIDNSIAVLSDLQKNTSYIFFDSFGSQLGLSQSPTVIDSAFESEIFACIPAEELIERHVLELRYFHLQKNNSIPERHSFNTLCHIHFKLISGKKIPILHRTYYIGSLPNGCIWLSLCIYTPFVEQHSKGIGGRIINNATGEIIPLEQYKQYDLSILSNRELDVLKLLSEGKGSKQIADILNISVYTVYRHRQNILLSLQVNNTAEAVQIGISLGII